MPPFVKVEGTTTLYFLPNITRRQRKRKTKEVYYEEVRSKEVVVPKIY